MQKITLYYSSNCAHNVQLRILALHISSWVILEHNIMDMNYDKNQISNHICLNLGYSKKGCLGQFLDFYMSDCKDSIMSTTNFCIHLLGYHQTSNLQIKHLFEGTFSSSVFIKAIFYYNAFKWGGVERLV